MNEIQKIIAESIEVKNKILQDERLIKNIDMIVKDTVDVLSSGGRLWFCGNGGSAADAQHLAAEFTGRFYKERKAYPAEALHCNSSYMTAVANDYGYDDVYARLIDGVGKRGDVLFCFSTSGNSKNIIRACSAAEKIGVSTISFTGEGGGELKIVSDFTICVPSNITPRIQEAHIMIGHIICELVEKKLVEKELFMKSTSKFFKWYVDWVKAISDKTSIFFSLPNELTPSFIYGYDVVVLEIFKKKDNKFDLSQCLYEICKMADETELTIYVDGTNNNRIDMYIEFKDFGFNEDEIDNNLWFIRYPKSKIKK